MGRSQVSFSGALLPPLKQKSKKKRKNRKRPVDRPKKFYKKIKSLPEGKCICGKKSIDSVGSCGENPYCILMLCKAKADIKVKRRNRKKMIHEDSLPNIFIENDSMESLQKRNRRIKSIRAHFSKEKYEVVKPLNVCTGVARDGAYCVTCKCVHYEPKHVWKTGNVVEDNIRKREDENYKLDKIKAIKKQNKIFVKAAKYLRRRRRRREKKLKLPNNALLKDYTDDGGGEIDSDLQYAVYESLQLRGTDPNKFNASLGELF